MGRISGWAWRTGRGIFGPWALVGIVAAVAVVFLASSDSNRAAGLREGDLLYYHIPAAEQIGQRLRAGEVPYWNPEIGCGMDQFVSIANSHCYPPFWIHAAVGARLGFGVLLVVHLLLAGGGLVAWLRCVGVRTGPALLGAAALLFGLIGESWWPAMLYTLAWTPVLFFIVDMPGRFTARRWYALAACLALQLLAGFPQHFLYSTMLLFGYVVVKGLKDRSLRLPMQCIGALAAAALLTAVQLVPTQAYISREGFRRGGLDPALVHGEQGGVPRESFQSQLHRITANVLDNSERVRYLSYRFSYGYLGLIVPFAVGVCVLCRPTWRTLYFLAAMGAGWYLCLGYTPGTVGVYKWLSYLVPWFGSFREPDRLLAWMLLGGSAVAALGAERIWPPAGEARCPRRVLAVVVVVFALQVARWATWGTTGGQAALWILGMLCVALGGAMGWLGRRGKTMAAGNVLTAAAFGLTLIDMWFAAGFVCPYFDVPEDRLNRIYTAWAADPETILTGAELQSLAARAGHDRLYIAEGYAPLRRPRCLPSFRTLAAYEQMLSGRAAKLDEWFLSHGFRRWRSMKFWDIPPLPHFRVFDWSSTGVLVARTSIENAGEHGWDEAMVLPSGAHVYTNRWAVPRASLWGAYRVVSADQALEDLVSTVESGRPRPVLLEELPSKRWRKLASGQGGRSEPELGHIEWISDEPERVSLRVETDVPVLLLLTDSYLPGWRCRVDGGEARILRANYLYRAVELVPGDHLVEFRYRTVGFVTGSIVSGVSLLVLIAAVVATRRRSRTPASGSEESRPRPV